MPNQDAGFKLIFSNPALVRELLSSGLCVPWRETMSEAVTLEKVSGSLVDERHLIRRENDLVWLYQHAEGRADSVSGENQKALVVVEFQSNPDPIMQVRMASYLSLFYEQAHRESKWMAPELPKALPVILYHGLPPWKAAWQFSDLWSSAYPELESLQLQLRPILIDIHNLDETELPPESNLIGLLFRIERSQNIEETTRWVRKMNQRLLEMREASLKGSITQWLLQYYLPTRMPDLDFEECRTIEEIIMTSEELTIDLTIPLKEKAFRMGIEQGIEQGIGQGIEKGMEKGTFSVLVKLLERRLGALSPELLGQLEKAGLPALNRLVDVAMDLESLEEVEVFLKGQV